MDFWYFSDSLMVDLGCNSMITLSRMQPGPNVEHIFMVGSIAVGYWELT